MDQKRNELKENLRRARYAYQINHSDQPDAEFRVPLKMREVNDLIQLFDDNDYILKACQSFGQQIEALYPELDKISQFAESIYKNGETFGTVADGKAILDAVQAIEEIIGKIGNDSEPVTD